MPDGQCPLFSGFLNSQEDGFHDCFIGGIGKFIFGVFSDFSVQVFNDVGRVDDLSDFQRKVEKSSEFLPVFPPAFDCIAIFVAPFIFQPVESQCGSFPVRSCVDIFHIRGEFLSVFPDYKPAGISDLMDDTDLFGRFGEYRANRLCKALQVVGSCDQDILDSSGFQISEHAQPKGSGFVFTQPESQNVFLSVSS